MPVSSLMACFDSHAQCSELNAYAGKGQSDTDAASIKTAHPIPAACGVFYFEITVEDKGADGYEFSGFKPDFYENCTESTFLRARVCST
jgi:hypothetical protein